MDFTPRELKLIDHLRKMERRWRWGRWLGLGMGGIFLVMYGWLAYVLLNQFDSDTSDKTNAVAIIALAWPIILLMLGLGCGFIGLAIRDWNGNVTRMLLLKLLDAQQNQPLKSAPPA